MGGMLRSTLFLMKGLSDFSRAGYAKASENFDPVVMTRDLRGGCRLGGGWAGAGRQVAGCGAGRQGWGRACRGWGRIDGAPGWAA